MSDVAISDFLGSLGIHGADAERARAALGAEDHEPALELALERCCGSRNERALAELSEACLAAGLRRLVVVGGSPDTRRELASVGGPLDLRLVDGTEATGAQAQRDRTRSRASTPRSAAAHPSFGSQDIAEAVASTRCSGA